LLDCAFETGLRIRPRIANHKVRKLAKRNTLFIYLLLPCASLNIKAKN
jgi:hypothetical protein